MLALILVVEASTVLASLPAIWQENRKKSNYYAIRVTDMLDPRGLFKELALSVPGTDWERLLVSLRHDLVVAAGDEIRFSVIDPRVILVPVSAAMVRTLGVKAYPIASDPSQFPEVVDRRQEHQAYGECRFQFEVGNPQYLRLDRNLFRRLSGNYAPARGDMVFSKGGQVVGIMVNKSYCAVLNRFTSMSPRCTRPGPGQTAVHRQNPRGHADVCRAVAVGDAIGIAYCVLRIAYCVLRIQRSARRARVRIRNTQYAIRNRDTAYKSTSAPQPRLLCGGGVGFAQHNQAFLQVIQGQAGALETLGEDIEDFGQVVPRSQPVVAGGAVAQASQLLARRNLP